MNDSIKKEIYSWLKSLFFAMIIVVICRTFFFSPSVVLGASMSPTFEAGNKIIVSKTSKINHFDMIVFHAPDADENYIKRVIGLPGDRISVKDEVLYINGKAYKEPYLKENKESAPFNKITGDFTLEEKTGKDKVPKGYLFVMGDNRLHSHDSREFGFIRADSVIGEAVFRFYPLKEIEIIK
ncbi:signal peptidase I [Niallia sp. 01092]|uniref:signal peptidase I n=1 Tax=unclassified Niallia TaxID=2837522 RepID=UPI003FD1C15F